MDKLFVDESGYTGFDLLNAQQQFQGAAAIRITDFEAENLIKKHFPKSKSQELKYRNLAKKEKNWNALIDLQKDILSNYLSLSYVCNKKYLLILMFLDIAVEPFYFERGIDFYENGNNYSIASLLYYAAPSLWGKKQFDNVIHLFQHAVKTKTDIAVQSLIQSIKLLRWEELPECWGPLALEDSECIKSIKSEYADTDAAFIVLFSLVSRIEIITENKYEVVHDKSRNLLQYNLKLKKLITHDKDIEFTQTKLTRIKFPLKLCKVSQIDSKVSAGVQLSDILIGGMIENANTLIGLKEKNEYNQSIPNLYADNQLIHLVPNIDFDEQKKFRSGTQAKDLINYFGRNFS
jgi:hypothetical protein